MAADDGNGEPRGKSRGDAQGGEADDLDALAGGLGSLEPGEGDADDEGHDLAAIGALSARNTHEPDGEAASASRPSVKSAVSAPAAAAPAAGAASVVVPAGPAAPAPSPAATPAAAPARAGWLTPLLVGIGVGIAIAGVTYALSQRQPPPAASATVETVVPPAAPAPASAAEAALVPANLAPVAAAPAPSAPAAAAVQPATSVASAAPHAGTGPRPRTGPTAAAVATPSPGPEPAAAAAPPPVLAVTPAGPEAEGEEPDLGAPIAEEKPKAPASMDALLDEALSPEARANELALRRQAAVQANAVPATPSREDVTQAMTVLLPAIRGCAMGQSGLATAGIVVHSDGRVASVDVAGAPFAGSASGRCMEGVIRRARFPHFTQPSFRIKFPLAIQ